MRDFLEYLGLQVLEGSFSSLPSGASRAVGRRLGRTARAAGLRRELVEQQIAGAFPEREERWVERKARACYEHFGAELASLARMGRRGPGDLLERTEGGDRFRASWEEATTGTGRGALVVTGHLGNWELAGAAAGQLGIPVSAVVKGQRNEKVDRHLARLRRRLGVEPIAMRWAGRGVPAALDEGRAVALVADQDARDRGVFVPFLGRPASTFRGPASLALRHDVPLLFGKMVRDGDVWRISLEPVEAGAADAARAAEGPPATDAVRADDDVRALTRAWVRKLDGAVRERPEQYFWFHRRWKTRPPGEEGGRIRAGPDG